MAPWHNFLWTSINLCIWTIYHVYHLDIHSSMETGCFWLIARTTIDLLPFWTVSVAPCGWVKRIMACLWLWSFPKWFGTQSWEGFPVGSELGTLKKPTRKLVELIFIYQHLLFGKNVLLIHTDHRFCFEATAVEVPAWPGPPAMMRLP